MRFRTAVQDKSGVARGVLHTQTNTHPSYVSLLATCSSLAMFMQIPDWSGRAIVQCPRGKLAVWMCVCVSKCQRPALKSRPGEEPICQQNLPQ